MQTLLEQIQTYLPEREKLAANISKKNVAWHLDHALKVILSVIHALKKSDPSKYKYKLNAARTYIFARNSIPRGRGKSPSIVLPPEQIKLDDLQDQLSKASNEWESLNNLDAKAYFHHRYFGDLNLKMSRRFLKIHTRHHLKIIKDILAHEEN